MYKYVLKFEKKYLFNEIQNYVHDFIKYKNFLKALPQFGILARSVIGLLILENESQASSILSRQPGNVINRLNKHECREKPFNKLLITIDYYFIKLGSRLKTPALPIWISSCCGHYGVMFNSNRELLRNYHAEKRFELHYYTCAGNYMVMTIDNRSQFDNDIASNNASNSNVSRDDGITSLVSRLIHTKWADAKITIKGAPSSSL